MEHMFIMNFRLQMYHNSIFIGDSYNSKSQYDQNLDQMFNFKGSNYEKYNTI